MRLFLLLSALARLQEGLISVAIAEVRFKNEFDTKIGLLSWGS